MGKFKFILIIVSFLLSIEVHAKAVIAKVTKIRGKVSILDRGSKVARPISVGDKIIEDASILTGDKSFARILFINDNTVMNVGLDLKSLSWIRKKMELALFIF